MKIYDCFTFFNELDLLDIRLHMLNDVVDYFVIVEIKKTHTGADKGLFFEEPNKDKYSQYKNKIIHIMMLGSNGPRLLVTNMRNIL